MSRRHVATLRAQGRLVTVGDGRALRVDVAATLASLRSSASAALSDDASNGTRATTPGALRGGQRDALRATHSS